MADQASLPKPEVRPRNWRLRLRTSGEVVVVLAAKLGSADLAYVKFITAEGLVLMYATETILSVEEFKP